MARERAAQGEGRGRSSRRSGALVIACDTDVVLDGKALGKPADAAEAREYLDRMSGRAHEVLSGLVVLDGRRGAERAGTHRRSSSRTSPRPRRSATCASASGEGRSGGYAIQTLGSTLVERVEGSVSNVVGLPVGLLLELAPRACSTPALTELDSRFACVWDRFLREARRFTAWAYSAI